MFDVVPMTAAAAVEPKIAIRIGVFGQNWKNWPEKFFYLVKID